MLLAWFLACDDGDAPGGHPTARPPRDDAHGTDAAAQFARAAPTYATDWSGPWTASVQAYAPGDPGPRAVADALGLRVTAWDGVRPETRPGEVVLLWLDDSRPIEDVARALAGRPGPQGEVVAVLAPGPAAWRADASERLPWANVALVDPSVSATRWLDPAAPLDAALAGRIAAREIADHYDLAYRPAPEARPGLDAYLGPFDAARLAAPDARTRAEAVRAADPGVVDSLASDPSVAVRLAVAEVTRTPAVRARLATDPDPQVRARAADGLDDIALLGALTTDPSSVVRVVATHRLAHLAARHPAEAGPALRKAAAATDAYQRWKAATGLGHVPGSTDALVPLLQDPDIDVRREAARSLGRLRDPAAVEPLLAALKDDNSFVRRWAAAALGEIRDGRARDALRTAAAEPTTLVAQAAAQALSALGEPTQAPRFVPPGKPKDDAALDALIASADATTRKDAAKFLAGRDDPARLAQLVADRDSEVRKSAVEAMGWHPATARLALPFLADPDNDVRVTALEALRRGGAGTVEAIAPLLAATDTEVRVRAAEALAALGPSPALAALVSDPDERVRAAAVAAHPDLLAPHEPAALVRRAAAVADPDPVVAPPGSDWAAWSAGVFAREDDLLHLRFSWNDEADRPAAYRALRPPVIRPYGHPDRG